MTAIPNREFSRLLETRPVLFLSTRSGRRNNVAPLIWYAPLSCDPPMIGISLKPSTKSYQNIRESGDFVLAVPGKFHLRALHFSGVHSGLDMDKMSVLNLPVTRAVSASPLLLSTCLANVECRVRDIIPSGNRPWITGEVLNVTVDPFSYDNGWLEDSVPVHYEGGSRYRVGSTIFDMQDIKPGYVPPDTVI